MASPTSVLSKTLQSLTLTKIRELEKQRKTYEARKSEFLGKAAASTDQSDRLACLLDGIRELYPPASKDKSLQNMERWLDQSRYDASIPSATLASFETRLRGTLDIQSRKLAMADLYSRLLTEWMDTADTQPAPRADEEDLGDDTFEVVEERQKQRLAELVDKFEEVVFTPLETSEPEMQSFLNDLFVDDDAKKGLADLREQIGCQSKAFMAETAPFNEKSVARCVRGLLTEDLLSDEKQAILRDFLDNPVALQEIADVLNMRFSDLRQWDWDAGNDGIPVMPRQQLNGKYRIWADDDIMQLIFVQYIGIRLCNLLKAALKGFVESSTIWQLGPDAGYSLTQQDRDRRHYFLGSPFIPPRTVVTERKSAWLEHFFLCQLPSGESSLFERGEGAYDDDSDGSDDDAGKFASDPDKKPQGSIKQRLLRQLTADLLVQRLRGVCHGSSDAGAGAAMIQTDLQWYATGLPHSTIYAAMRFVGFPEDWIVFLTKYLEAPLNLDASSDGRTPKGPRKRRRGVPMAHASEKFAGELVLFFLDLTVNVRTGALLYRLHDDIWLVGDPAKTAEAWGCMQSFAKTFGLEFNRHKTGSVYLAGAKRDARVAAALPQGPVTMGFLRLDPASGNWEIDRAMVYAHVKQLQKQLAEAPSVLAWVQTWNSCIGRFFSYTFGEPAFCFGRAHLDGILETHEAIQRAIFTGKDGMGKDVVAHVKGMIRERFGMQDLPDAFVFLPEQLGGLGLRNPFVSLFLVRGNLEDNPQSLVDRYLKQELEAYQALKKNFDTSTDQALMRRLKAIYPADANDQLAALRDGAWASFMPFEEFARFREVTRSEFWTTYCQLLTVPNKEEIHLGQDVKHALAQLGDQLDLGRLDAEKKWLLQLYASELLELCGGLSLVDKQFLPVGVLAMMRGKKVTWQMVL
jgi:hypothetical protein